MSAYFLHLNGEQKGAYSLAQIKAMYDAGSINSTAQYWTEGMSEWGDIDGLFASKEVPVQSTEIAENASSVATTKEITTPLEEKRIENSSFSMVLIIAAIIVVVFLALNYDKANPWLKNAFISEEQRTEIRNKEEILNSLKEIEALVKQGVNFDNYSKILSEKGPRISVLINSLKYDDFKSNTESALRVYNDARDFWSYCLGEREEFGMVYFSDEMQRKFSSYDYAAFSKGKVSVQSTSIIWDKASTYLKSAEACKIENPPAR